jgi:hypothetical protein
VAHEDGFQVRHPSEAIRTADLVVGCTGSEALDITLAPIKAGALLVNMASSDLEFSPWKVSQASEAVSSDRSDADTHPWRHLFRIKLRSREFFLANGGFPVDFSGAVDPIPPHRIQLTRALLLAGALQAVRSTGGGLQELSSEMQDVVLRAYDSDPKSRDA